jgi:hypothetical protein
VDGGKWRHDDSRSGSSRGGIADDANLGFCDTMGVITTLSYRASGPRNHMKINNSSTRYPSMSGVIFDTGVPPAFFCVVGSQGPPFSGTQLTSYFNPSPTAGLSTRGSVRRVSGFVQIPITPRTPAFSVGVLGYFQQCARLLRFCRTFAWSLGAIDCELTTIWDAIKYEPRD